MKHLYYIAALAATFLTAMPLHAVSYTHLTLPTIA